MKFYLIAIAILVLAFTSCSSKPGANGDDVVNLICDCALEAGVEDEYDLAGIQSDEKKAKKLVKCILPILKDARSEISEMKDDERSKYFGDAIKAAVDCECGQNFLLVAAKIYDNFDGSEELGDLIYDLERFVEEEESYDFYTSLEICDCVGVYENDEYYDQEMIDACEELQVEWGERLSEASPEEQEEMMETIEDCITEY